MSSARRFRRPQQQAHGTHIQQQQTQHRAACVFAWHCNHKQPLTLHPQRFKSERRARCVLTCPYAEEYPFATDPQSPVQPQAISLIRHPWDQAAVEIACVCWGSGCGWGMHVCSYGGCRATRRRRLSTAWPGTTPHPCQPETLSETSLEIMLCRYGESVRTVSLYHQVQAAASARISPPSTSAVLPPAPATQTNSQLICQP